MPEITFSQFAASAPPSAVLALMLWWFVKGILMTRADHKEQLRELKEQHGAQVTLLATAHAAHIRQLEAACQRERERGDELWQIVRTHERVNERAVEAVRVVTGRTAGE